MVKEVEMQSDDASSFDFDLEENVEVQIIKDNLEDQNNQIYEKCQMALMVCNLMKTSMEARIEVEERRQYEEGMGEEIRRLQNELDMLRKDCDQLRGDLNQRDNQLRKLQTENTRLSNELIFTKQKISCDNLNPSPEILSKSDRLALKKMSELVQNGAQKEALIQEAERIMRTRRLTLHNLRQSKRMDSIEMLNSLKGLLEKVSLLEKDLSLKTADRGGHDMSTLMKQLLVGLKTNNSKLEELKSYIVDMPTTRNTFKSDVFRALKEMSDLIDMMKSGIETHLAPSVRNSDDVKPPEMSPIGIRKQDESLLEQIKSSSISKLKKTSERLKKSKPPIDKIHEIQDSLKAAIEKHRIAMSEEAEEDLDDSWL